MWLIRFLSGPLAGKSISLKLGRNTVGRAPHCEVVIPSPNISKEHTQIEVYNDKIIITDLKSRNGTFINGVQITSHKLQAGERISFFDIMGEIMQKSPTSIRDKMPQQPRRPNVEQPLYQGNLAYEQIAHEQPELTPAAGPQVQAQKNFGSYVVKYIDEVVLPGVYKLTEWMEYRTVLALFVAAYIVFVTVLSTVPLIRILKSSIQKEAQSRAQTIARSLARDNLAAVMQGQSSLVTTENADREAGVTAYVLSNNGDILAPPKLAGQYLTEVAYVHEARKLNQESVKQINDDTIVAVYPIRFHNPQTGNDMTAAHSVVVYNMGSLALDDSRTLSLFVQILFIAILLGGILFFFLYKLILLPINQINLQVDKALRDGDSQISSTIQMPEIQTLASNINSAVHRGASGGFASANIQQFEADRTLERQNIVNLVGFAAISILPNEKVIATVNEHFLNQIGISGNWTNLAVNKILDQALKLNLESLIDKVVSDPSQIFTDQLEISNHNYEISAQGIYGEKGIAYIVVVFIPKTGGLL